MLYGSSLRSSQSCIFGLLLLRLSTQPLVSFFSPAVHARALLAVSGSAAHTAPDSVAAFVSGKENTLRVVCVCADPRAPLTRPGRFPLALTASSQSRDEATAHRRRHPFCALRGPSHRALHVSSLGFLERVRRAVLFLVCFGGPGEAANARQDPSSSAPLRTPFASQRAQRLQESGYVFVVWAQPSCVSRGACEEIRRLAAGR